MKLMKDMLDDSVIKEFMSKLDLPEKGSNRGYEPIQIIECFWTSIWIGAVSFSHSAYLRYDKVVAGNIRMATSHFAKHVQ
jgi:hypothetical protein